MHQVSSTELDILHAAEAEFIEKGFSGARTVSIAQAAGVTHTMLHYYYRTKDQLFERVLTPKLTLMIDSVFESLDKSEEGSGVLDRIEAFIYRHYQYLSDNSKLPLFVLNEVVHNPDRIELLKGMLTDKFRTIDTAFGMRYAKAINEGEISSMDLLTLITDILLLNLSSIVMRPLFQTLTESSAEEYDNWRIAENLTLIRKRLQP